MQLRYPKIFITGLPGVGKTTLVKRIIAELDPVQITGFYTAEIRKRGVRQGFELCALNGDRQILSGVNVSSPWRVGKYRVDVPGFDQFLESLALLNSDAEIIVIDEIGKMEAFSHQFQGIVNRLLASDKKILGTIALKGTGFIHQIKQMPQVKLFEVTLSNRDRLITEILI